MLTIIRLGLADGISQPGDFSVGMSYRSAVKQYVYDVASRVGQVIGRLRARR